jgi:3-oxoadipate enol-lactonase
VKIEHEWHGPPGAPAVTLSHPLGATLRIWDAHVPALTPRFRVLRYDTRGHGGSEVPPGPCTLEQMADDVVGLLDAAGIARTHFVGMSMGGLVGMTLALTHPDRVRSLVLCDTTACYGPALEAMWRERLRVAETAGMTEELIGRTVAVWFTPDFLARGKAQVDRVREMLRRTDPRGYAAAIRAIGFVDLRPRLGAIRCPTLVVVGEDDPGTPPAMAREIADRIPGARLEVLPGARHAAVVERAEEFTRLLLEFLAASG